MKRNTSKFGVAPIALALFLSACGGGGGDTPAAAAPPASQAPTTPVPPTPPAPGITQTPPVVNIPNPSGPPVRAYTLADLPTSRYPGGSPEKSMFDTLNRTRVGGGFGGLEQNAAVDRTAKGHADYVLANFVNNGVVDGAALGVLVLADGTLAAHAQIAGKKGFTGVRVEDRLAAQGYKSFSSGENVAFSVGTKPGEEPSGTSCLTDLINSVFHRAGLLSSLFREVGFGISASVTDANGYKTLACVINFASAVAPPAVASDFVGIYPFAGQTGLGLAMSLEIPDPAPEFAVKGYPVSFQGVYPIALTVTSFVLRDPSGTLVPTKLVTRAQSFFLAPNEAYLVPNGALKANTVYFATFTGNSNGVPLSKSWSFTTGSK